MKILSGLKKYKSKTALILGEKKITYLKLNKLSEDLSQNLEKNILTFLICENDIESIIFYLSNLKQKSTILLLEKNITKVNLKELVNKYQPRYIFYKKNNDYELDNFHLKIKFMNYNLFVNKENIKFKIDKNLRILISTSGTTGSPKYVKITKQNIESNIISIQDYLKLKKTDCTITTLPMNYVYGLSIINSHLYVGAKIVLNETSIFDKKFWNSLSTNKVTNLNGVPYLYEILDKINFLKRDLSSIKFFTQAGGRIDKKIQKKIIKFCEINKKKIFFMYGAAEATARMSFLTLQHAKKKIGSIGKPIRGGKFWLENKKRVKIKKNNKIGELIFKGKNVSPGYAENYHDLAKQKNNYILRTGDYAKRDNDGFYFLLGRSDKFIKIQGNRLNLNDIELYLLELGIKSVCKLNKENKISIFVEKNVDETMVLKKIKEKITIHPSNYFIKKISKFPLNKNLKISYNHKIFN